MIAVAVATEHTAHASPALFGNPFLSADEVQAQRGAVANAEFEIRYRKDDVDWQANVDTSEVVIVLAEDWAAVEQNGRTELLDFKLMRRFEISPAGSTFISFNLNSRLMFAVYERFNRAAMAAAITAAGLPFKVPPACDADTELGVTLPPSRAPSQVELTQSADSISATCDGRQIGLLKLAAKDAPPPPATFWPALVASFQIHPLILAAAQKVGGVPTHLESTFSVMEQKTTRSWDLVYARAETKPYPLSAQLRNATVDWLAGTVGAPLAQTAVDALQGKAGGGPPTAASSERTLAALVEANDPAAAMALLPTIGMFPDVLAGCRAGGKSAGCAIVAGLPTYMAADPAVAAVFKMIAPHAPNDTEWPAKALNDMVAAQKSPLGGSPILAGYSPILCAARGLASRRRRAPRGWSAIRRR
jgi:hypothetical protein